MKCHQGVMERDRPPRGNYQSMSPKVEYKWDTDKEGIKAVNCCLAPTWLIECSNAYYERRFNRHD